MSTLERALGGPEIEVVAKATRRRFTLEYKRKIVREADGCKTPGPVGALLRREGLYSSHLATWRAARERVRDRYLPPRQSGRIYAPGERSKIVAAELAALPDWIADEFGASRGDRGIRRHWITYTDESPSEVSSSWFPAELAQTAPKLLHTDRLRAGPLAYIEQTTGRVAVHARDQLSARLATATERNELELTGRAAAVLVVHHVVFDANDRPVVCVQAVYPPDGQSFEQQYSVRR